MDLSWYYLQVSEARQNHDDEAIKKAVNEYDEALERLLSNFLFQIFIRNDCSNTLETSVSSLIFKRKRREMLKTNMQI